MVDFYGFHVGKNTSPMDPRRLAGLSVCENSITVDGSEIPNNHLRCIEPCN